jgi:hypothetical protein
MAHNLKKFSTEADYSAAELNYPAVSWITGTNSVHFDATAPATFGGLTVHYLIDQSVAGVNVTLFNGGGSSSSESGGGDSESGGGGVMPTRMIVDGVEETVVNTWVFETVGEHIVQYEFQDNTIPEGFLNGVPTAKNVTVGTDIIGISALAFNLNLTSASVEAATPPTITDESSFGGGAYGQNYTIYVPTSAVSTYRTQWSSLSSRIQAIQ